MAICIIFSARFRAKTMEVLKFFLVFMLSCFLIFLKKSFGVGCKLGSMHFFTICLQSSPKVRGTTSKISKHLI